MASTKRTIRQAIYDEKLWRRTVYGSITAATVRSITSTALGQGGDAPQLYFGEWVYFPSEAAADQKRRAGMFHSASSRLEHQGPDYSLTGAVVNVASADYFEVVPYDPVDLINRAITLALTRRCFSLQYDVIVPSGNNRYVIGTAPFDVISTMESPEQQIFEVEELLDGTDPATSIWRPWDRDGRTWQPEADDNVLAVRFEPAPARNMRITWKKPYVDLGDDNTATTACPLAYVKWAALVELYEMLEQRAIADGASSSSYRNLKEGFLSKMILERKKALTVKWGGQVVLRRTHAYRTVGPRHSLR